MVEQNPVRSLEFRLWGSLFGSAASQLISRVWVQIKGRPVGLFRSLQVAPYLLQLPPEHAGDILRHTMGL